MRQKAVLRIRTAAIVCLLLSALPAHSAEWDLKLPDGAAGFSFGPGAIPGLTAVTKQIIYNEQTGYGFSAESSALTGGGRKWPDVLSGQTVASEPKAEFQAKLPNGEYWVWLCAGKQIVANPRNRQFLLKINDKTLFDDTPGDEQYASEKYLYRFMWTQFSERPHGLWLDYIDKMYAGFIERIMVRDGRMSVTFGNHFISALIAVPVAQKTAFDALLADIQARRMEEFEADLTKRMDPDYLNGKRSEGHDAGDYLVYVPEEAAPLIQPNTRPSEQERKQTSIQSAGTPGELVLLKIAIVPFTDVGSATLVPGDLTGPGGRISATNIRGFYKNYQFYRRFEGKHLEMGESVLLPTLTLNLEKGVTELFCLLLRVPEEASAGIYRGTFTFKPDKGRSVDVPVQFEVYPFTLEKDLPVSYTMWNSRGYDLPFLSAELKRKILKDRLQAQRDIGFTSLDVPCPTVKSLKDGKVTITIDTMPYEVAKEVGLGRRPEQGLYVANFWAGAGRSLAGGALGPKGGGVDLKQPEFTTYLKDIIAQFKAFIDKSGLPIVVCAVDEPREANINPWNRNYNDTCILADLLRAGGIKTMINPMYDNTNGKDYTGFVDHLDVYSSHAWKQSERSFHLAQEKGKTIWLYNSGMDRYTWGFYNWRFQSQGRMEWAFFEAHEHSEFGYSGQDWYNPFGCMGGYAPSAPYAKYKGGHLFQSCYYEVSMGITDYAYIYTLTEALKKAGPDKAETVRAAKAFLASIGKEMPEFAKIKGLASGAQVGMGSTDEARKHVDEWRAKIAGFLKDLKK